MLLIISFCKKSKLMSGLDETIAELIFASHHFRGAHASVHS